MIVRQINPCGSTRRQGRRCDDSDGKPGIRRVDAVPVNEGDRVISGASLVAIDGRDTALRAAESKAALTVLVAEADVLRVRIAPVDQRPDSRVDAESQHQMAKADWQRADALKQH